jgi:MarR family transcriptional regulator, organic hydroperoxide resistance regulator
MAPVQPIESVEELRAALRDFLSAQRRLRGREAQRPGELSFSQYAVLRVLADDDEHSAGELAVAAELTPASITKMLDGLSRAGLLERVRDESDRRRVGVRITAEGREIYEQKDRKLTAAWMAEVHQLEPAEVDAMIAAIRRLAALFDAI